MISVSTTVQPRCVSPRGTPSNAGGSTGPTSADSSNEDRSDRSEGSSRGTYHLTNPVTGANTIPAIVGKVVRALMGLVGAVALLMFVIGGIRWILSAGDPKDVQAVQDMLRNGSVGLLIIFLSYTVITVGMGLVNELAGQGDGGGAEQTEGASSGATSSRSGVSPLTNTTDRTETPTPTPPAPGTVAACNATYPASPYMRGDCRGCQASCMSILCRRNASDEASDPMRLPTTDPRDVSPRFVFPAGVSAATTECLTRCRNSADCPAG